MNHVEGTNSEMQEVLVPGQEVEPRPVEAGV
jgi:hypothetical protein